ncbi:MAG: VOC family protein [Chloroflexota bacterium]
MPIIYVTNMQRSLDFYRAFCDAIHSQSGMWSELTIGDAHLALHHVDQLPAESRIELAFLSSETLEQVIEHLGAANIPLERGITDEGFGRSIRVRDPDGLPIQINEHDPEFYP